MLLFVFIRCLCELQGGMRFLTRSYYRITSLCANKKLMVLNLKYFFFGAEKRQIWQNGLRNGLHSFERLDK